MQYLHIQYANWKIMIFVQADVVMQSTLTTPLQVVRFLDINTTWPVVRCAPPERRCSEKPWSPLHICYNL